MFALNAVLRRSLPSANLGTLSRAAVSASIVPRTFSAQASRPFSSAKTLNMAPTASRKVPEGYKEDMSKGAMLRFEDSLPRLPIPTLQETSERYLHSLKALLSKEELERSTKIVQEFIKPGGEGEKLQKRLNARRDDPKHKNWIYEWWNDAAYLTYRDPVVPYVSYFYSHRDDRKRRDPAKRAAALTTAALEFKKDVDNNTLEVEFMRKVPVAMETYQWMFNTCRIPAQPADYPKKYNFVEHKYILVIHKNQFFKVMHEVDGQQLTTAELEKSFRRVYQMAQLVPPVGALTTENRDVWTKARETLIAAHPGNKAALEAIEASSFVVCLDDAAPVTLEERANQYWHGDGANRFFDKPAQFIVNTNGTSGFIGEHSMMDGTTTHRLNDYVNDMITNNKLDFSNPSVRTNLPEPTLIKFHLTDAVKADINQAQRDFDLVIGQHELRIQAYQGYGKGLIKKFKCSPDAYVQMTIQLAYKKMFGVNRPTYESAQVRRYQQGRTETCRSCSVDSVAFCNAMVDADSTPEHCISLFRKALDAHVKYTNDALSGYGVDRHLFGLKKSIQSGEEVPAIFKDPAYTYSSTWFLSTSQLSSEFFNAYGWSQVVDDGFGIAYMINENSIQFNVASKGLGSERMSFYLNEAAGELRDLLSTELVPKAKL